MDYSPIESLKEEVDRFHQSNTFNPLLVTNFYAQARIVLSYVEELEEALDEICDKEPAETYDKAKSARKLLSRYKKTRR